MENLINTQDTEVCTASLLCAPSCKDSVCIPRSRYNGMMRAEIELGILRRAYQTVNSFSLDYIMDIIFDPALKYKPETTNGTETRPEESAAGAE